MNKNKKQAPVRALASFWISDQQAQTWVKKNNKYIWINTNKNEEHFNVLRKIQKNPESTQRELAEELGFKVIDKKDKVVEMDDNNIIVRVSKIPESQKEKFKVGGTFKIWEEGVKAAKNAMQVLDDTGKVLMNIVGGERIFSIKHTESLIALAKKVDRGEADEEELGKLMAKIITIQNTQEPEYVD